MLENPRKRAKIITTILMKLHRFPDISSKQFAPNIVIYQMEFYLKFFLNKNELDTTLHLYLKFGNFCLIKKNADLLVETKFLIIFYLI